ncbi:hypothetical protein [Microbacterium sp. P02]|uniref:hypothetical protein n=1 Tax=Microbacterium sp. P02 TaxID=3366260 RepID=UPI00366E4C1C
MPTLDHLPAEKRAELKARFAGAERAFASDPEYVIAIAESIANHNSRRDGVLAFWAARRSEAATAE